ncbi:hypothetical protein ACVIDN_002554 [Rhizobium brockwellii]
MLAYEFSRWWAYRRISHSMMWRYIWGAPLVLTGVILCVYVVLPVKPRLGGDTGLLKSLSQILALLPGFFISALAAVATFNRPEMDETMPAPAPKVKIAHRGILIDIELTRRMFLSYLFSYLSILSVALFIVVVVSPYLDPSLRHVLSWGDWYITGDQTYFFLKYSFICVISYFFSSLLFTTLHGVYFLCERIHMPNT